MGMKRSCPPASSSAAKFRKTHSIDGLSATVLAVLEAERVTVIAGAGISESAGISTFRGPGSIGSKKQALFRYPRAAADPQEFYEVMESLRKTSQSAKPTTFHHMVGKLSAKGSLGLFISQNIDGLHTKVCGQLEEKTVLLHGTLHQATCTLRGHQLTGSEHEFGHDCPDCVEENAVRRKRDYRRCTWDKIGTLLPQITLYDCPQNITNGVDGFEIGEKLNKEAEMLEDQSATLIIAGTSLSIPDLKRWVVNLAKAVRCQGGLVIWVGLGRCNVPCVDYELSIRCDGFAVAVLNEMHAATSRIENAA